MHHQRPIKLDSYLEEFKAPTAVIVPGPSVLECVGCARNEHAFLEAEGFFKCRACKECLCRHCLWDLKQTDPETALCMPCARSMFDYDDDFPTEMEMRTALADSRQTAPARASHAEVTQLHDDIVLVDDALDMFSESFKGVTYPLCTPAVLHVSSEQITRMQTVAVRDIGGLVRDEAVEAKHVAGLVHLLASLVNLDKKHENGKITYHHAMPRNIVKFGSQGRVHAGERLCKRAVRHAMDPAAPGVIGATIVLGEYDGETCGVRPVMHDNTNVPMRNPSDADLNRALCSQCHGQCCAKGGVSVQLCGWIRNLKLCTGGIDDSGYIEAVGVLEEQKKFAEADETSAESFLNIFDKGHRCTLVARKQGQNCLQPEYAKSDEQFRRDQTLHSVCVAVIRSGNERAVKMAKNSWLIKRGCVDQIWDLNTLADVWLAWGFQVNFEYDIVL